MIQRATLMYLLATENQAIRDYTQAFNIADTAEQKRIFLHILNEEKDHKRELEDMLKQRIYLKGQKQITSLLSLE